MQVSCALYCQFHLLLLANASRSNSRKSFNLQVPVGQGLTCVHYGSEPKWSWKSSKAWDDTIRTRKARNYISIHTFNSFQYRKTTVSYWMQHKPSLIIARTDVPKPLRVLIVHGPAAYCICVHHCIMKTGVSKTFKSFAGQSLYQKVKEPYPQKYGVSCICAQTWHVKR